MKSENHENHLFSKDFKVNLNIFTLHCMSVFYVNLAIIICLMCDGYLLLS